MKPAFFYDVQEISVSAFRGFISTFRYDRYELKEVESDNSDSDLSDFDPDLYGCGEITPEVESLVEESWEICDPLDEVYGATTSQLIRETVVTATEETQCAGLKIFKAIIPSEDKNLLEICTEISYWCCCETLKRVSPVIAEATSNLMF